MVEAPNDREEGQFVAEEIQRRRLEKNEPWEAFAVLFRMNAQSRVLEENLRRLQIPYRIVGGKSFFDRREVKDLLAYMTVLVNPGADASLLRIINTPARGLSPATVDQALTASVRGRSSLWEALRAPELAGEVSSRTANSIQAFVGLVERYQGLLKENADAAEVMKQFLAEIGYAAELRRSCRSAEEASERQGSMDDLLRDLGQFTARSSKGLAGFLDEVVLDQEREEEKQEDIENKRGVTLITMHAAKGLEFHHVYIVGLEEGVLPHERSKSEGTIEEERRLLYVGITRARQTLTMSHCRDRMKYGSAAACQPSSFLKELPEEWIEKVDLQKLLSTPVAANVGRSRFAQMRATLGN